MATASKNTKAPTASTYALMSNTEFEAQYSADSIEEAARIAKDSLRGSDPGWKKATLSLVDGDTETPLLQFERVTRVEDGKKVIRTTTLADADEPKPKKLTGEALKAVAEAQGKTPKTKKTPTPEPEDDGAEAPNLMEAIDTLVADFRASLIELIAQAAQPDGLEDEGTTAVSTPKKVKDTKKTTPKASGSEELNELIAAKEATDDPDEARVLRRKIRKLKAKLGLD